MRRQAITARSDRNWQFLSVGRGWSDSSRGNWFFSPDNDFVMSCEASGWKGWTIYEWRWNLFSSLPEVLPQTRGERIVMRCFRTIADLRGDFFHLWPTCTKKCRALWMLTWTSWLHTKFFKNVQIDSLMRFWDCIAKGFFPSLLKHNSWMVEKQR